MDCCNKESKGGYNDIDIAILNLAKCNCDTSGLSLEELLEITIKNNEGLLAHGGALSFSTGEFTGRSPSDRYIVCDEETQNYVNWNSINLKFSEDGFNCLLKKMLNQYANTGIACSSVSVCNHKLYNKELNIFSTLAWQQVLIKNLFFDSKKCCKNNQGFVIIWAHDFFADPLVDGTKSKNFTIINIKQKKIIIGGTAYSGELKKSVFSAMNYILPKEHDVLPMHCSATLDQNNDIVLYFGLSGTGKTTLSMDSGQKLIGDDEHGWSTNNEIFNFEAGCYAKILNITEDKEPQVYNAIRYGALVENVVLDAERKIEFSNSKISSNIRATFPLTHIKNCAPSCVSGVPKNIFFLSCDAYGVLPPISKLNFNQAIYYFLSGYTSKIDGTEQGVVEPQPTFSACFGEPFFPLKPTLYADLLYKRLIQNNGINVWLVNTGWTAGGYNVGMRIDIKCTRQIIRTVLSGELNNVEFQNYGMFNLSIPNSCSFIPTSILHPRNSWSNSVLYDEQEKRLALAFIKNFERYSKDVSKEVVCSGPKI